MKKAVNHKTFSMGQGNYQVLYSLRDDNNETRNMTNEKRVLLERINLLADEYINPVSDEVKQFLVGKRVYICREPEQIDTFQGWKEKGYFVKRGQKALTEIKLYNGYSWKKYHFFAASQVCKAR